MDGFINLNKKAGESSHHAVAALRRLFSCKAGHCGTLDPAATGVLPIALDRATRLAEYVTGGEKRYIGEICFGVTTDSYDAAGTVTAVQDASGITAEAVTALLPHFQGEIMQAPPPVSALKRGGEPLYKKVRRGETVITEPRRVQIYQLRLLDFWTEGMAPHCRLEIVCGQGTYIRSLAHDLGRLLGCGAHLCALQRTQVGNFRLENSYTLDEISSFVAAGREDFLISMREALCGIPMIEVPDSAAQRLAHGNPAHLPHLAEQPLVCVLDTTGTPLGVAAVENGMIAMKKVLVDAAKYDAQPLTACAIGYFDGLHLGHRALMSALYRCKCEQGGRSAVVTFSPHPLALLRGSAPAMLTSTRLKADILQRYFAVDEIITLHFDEKLMNSTPEQFVEEVIVAKLGVRDVIVGYNFTYAAQGKGTPALLREQCAARGIRVTVIDEVCSPHGTVSASLIRRYLQAGDLAAVNEMLGYWYALEGEIECLMRTKCAAFPNQDLPEYVFRPEDGLALPPSGVYAGRLACGKDALDCLLTLTLDATGHSIAVVQPLEAESQRDEGWLRVWLGKYLRPLSTDGSSACDQQTADRQAAMDFLSQILPNQHLPKQIE